LKILEVIERDHLQENVRRVGDFLKAGLLGLCDKYPTFLKTARGYGFILGLELTPANPAFASSDKPSSIQFVNKLHSAGLLTIPAGPSVVRLLPSLNLRQSEAQEGLDILEATAQALL
jgi:acetylornithine/succinyldiaminopimelate/putrescine aminotransferase